MSEIQRVLDACENLTQAVESVVPTLMQEAQSAINKVADSLDNALNNKMKLSLYVNALDGDDKNVGSISEPLKTLSAAVSKLTPGCQAKIHLAANGVIHSFPTLGVPDCACLISTYVDDSWSVKKLLIKSTGTYPVYPLSFNANISFELFGEFDKVFECASARFFENPGQANYSIASDSSTYPVIVTLPAGTTFFPMFIATNYTRHASGGFVVFSNTVFCKDFTGTNGDYTFTKLETIRLDATAYSNAIIASFNNVAFHANAVVNTGVKLGEGTYLYTASEDIVAEV